MATYRWRLDIWRTPLACHFQQQVSVQAWPGVDPIWHCRSEKNRKNISLVFLLCFRFFDVAVQGVLDDVVMTSNFFESAKEHKNTARIFKKPMTKNSRNSIDSINRKKTIAVWYLCCRWLYLSFTGLIIFYQFFQLLY